MSIDCAWPEGRGGVREMTGRARDLLTGADGAPTELAAGAYRILASAQREILSIKMHPEHPRAQALVGVRAGGSSRRALDEAVGELCGTPIYQLLDDFAGASLVGAWIWSLWPDERDASPAAGGARRRMLDVCAGYAEGASSLLPDG